MPNNKRRKFNPFKALVMKLLKAKRFGGGAITFYYKDGSIRNMNINDEVFFDKYGNERKIQDVITILNDLKHDFKASYYKIS